MFGLNLLTAKLIGIALVALAIAGAIFHVRYTYNLVAKQEQQITALNASINSLQKSIEVFKAVDAAQNTEMIKYQEKLNATKSSLDAAIKRLRNNSAASGVPAIAPSACGNKGEAISELLDRYGERLYRNAARADQVVEQLTAAQNLLEIRDNSAAMNNEQRSATE